MKKESKRIYSYGYRITKKTKKKKKKKKKTRKRRFPCRRENMENQYQQYQKQKNKIGRTQVSTNKKIKKRLNCSVPTSVLFGWLVYQVLVSK